MPWSSDDTWIVITGMLCACACALLGNFLLLRRMSMMGDAISHAVLPGLAIAFLWTGQRSSLVMFFGAAGTGLLTALFTQWIHRFGKVEQGAAMGVAFSTLFALGLVLIKLAADSVHLDADCVLYGAIEWAPMYTSYFGAPRSVYVLGGVLAANILFVVLLFKELRISSFDEDLATTQGIPAPLMHYLLMVMVAVTATAAFESVGSILVIAMMIVPAATAHLLTERLWPMIGVSLLCAALSAVLGHAGAIAVPGWFGRPSTGTASMMAVVTGLLFVTAMFAAPNHGLASKWLHRVRLHLQILREDILGTLYRLEEFTARPAAAGATDFEKVIYGSPFMLGLARRSLLRRGLIEAAAAASWQLTGEGRRHAQSLVRSHRLWESYLDKHFELPPDHLHAPAEKLEHVTDAEFQRRLDEEVEAPVEDPHGKKIPGRADEG